MINVPSYLSYMIAYATVFGFVAAATYAWLTYRLLAVAQRTREDNFLPVIRLSAETGNQPVKHGHTSWTLAIENIGYGPALNLRSVYWWQWSARGQQHKSVSYSVDLKPHTRNMVRAGEPTPHSVALVSYDMKIEGEDIIPSNDPNALNVVLDYEDILGNKFRTILEGRQNTFIRTPKNREEPFKNIFPDPHQ